MNLPPQVRFMARRAASYLSFNRQMLHFFCRPPVGVVCVHKNIKYFCFYMAVGEIINQFLVITLLFEKMLFVAIFHLKKCEWMLYLRCKKEN